MIITTANEFVSKIHDRMPVLLQPKDFDAWLTGHAGVERLRPAANNYLQMWTGVAESEQLTGGGRRSDVDRARRRIIRLMSAFGE